MIDFLAHSTVPRCTYNDYVLKQSQLPRVLTSMREVLEDFDSMALNILSTTDTIAPALKVYATCLV